MNAHSPIITVRAATSQDRAAVSAFIAARPDAQLFQRAEWSEAVEKACGHKSHLLLAHDEHDLLVGMLPLSEVRSPLFGSALVSAGFGVGGGILGSGVDALAEAAWSLAQQRGCASVELRGGPVPTGWETREGVYAGFVRDLPRDEDAILKSIPKRQRAEVRKGQGAGLEVSIGRDLEAHYRVYSESVRNHGTPIFPRSLFKAMLGAFGEDADILVVRKDGRPVSAVFNFYFKGVVYPYWGGGIAEARMLRANELAYYELMCHAARRGCTRFDYGRSKVGTGPFAFKRNWGFEPEPLVYAVRGEVRETNPLNPKYQLKIKLWKKLPLWAANLIGPHIARGLG